MYSMNFRIILIMNWWYSLAYTLKVPIFFYKEEYFMLKLSYKCSSSAFSPQKLFLMSLCFCKVFPQPTWLIEEKMSQSGFGQNSCRWLRKRFVPKQWNNEFHEIKSRLHNRDIEKCITFVHCFFVCCHNVCVMAELLKAVDTIGNYSK